MILTKNENIVFKNFQVVRPLGSGSFGNVYEVYDSEKKERFALKEVLISAKSVPNFLAEVLPDCVVQHENIQKYHPFVISRRPDVLKNFYDMFSSKHTYSVFESSYEVSNNVLQDNRCLAYEEMSSSLEVPTHSAVKRERKAKKSICFQNISTDKNNKQDVKKAKKNTETEQPFKRSTNWCFGNKLKQNAVNKTKRFYMYLKTEICDFSLRDFIDFRNHFMYRAVGEETSVSFEGNLNNRVQIPVDLFKQAVEGENRVNKKFSMGIFRCILLGLIHLHSFGISHNDIKSSNILLDSSEGFRPKIADFGLRTFCNYDHGLDNSANPHSLYEYYSNMTPCDHLNRNKVDDCRSLIYILYEMLYPCKTQSEMIYRLRDLKRLKKVPLDFRLLYISESVLIERVLRDNEITAKGILSMLDGLEP